MKFGPDPKLITTATQHDIANLKLFEGSGHGPAEEQILYKGSGAQFMQAIRWLAEAQDNFLIKFTGGCLKMNPQDALGFYDLIVEAFDCGDAHSPYAGALLGGATISELRNNPSIRRPSVPEVVPLLERVFPELRALGVVPAALSSRTETGELLVTRDLHEGKEWEVKLDPYQRRAVLIDEKTPYLWDAEGQAGLRIQESVNLIRALRGAVLISYDGGVGTRNEIEGWLQSSVRGMTPQVILITGSDPDRTTDSLAHNQVWQHKYRGLVHIVEKNSDEIRKALVKAGAFRTAHSAGDSNNSGNVAA